MLGKHVLQYDLMIFYDFPIARLDEGAQQIDDPAQSQVNLAALEHYIDGFAHIFELVVVADDQLPVVPVNLLDYVSRNVVKRPLALQ